MHSEFWITLAAILLLIGAAGLVSAADAALTAASRARLRALAERGSRGAARAAELAEDRDRAGGALFLAGSLALLAAAVLAATLAAPLGRWGMVLATLAVAGGGLLFGAVLPRMLALARPEATAALTAPAVAALTAVLAPVVALAVWIAQQLLRPFGPVPDATGGIFAPREDIAGAIAAGLSEGGAEKENRDRLLGALDLGERTVDEIMRHRRQIEMINADQTPGDILTQVLASQHTRLPVFRETDDNILGVVHAKDLLREVDRLVRGGNGDAEGLQALDIVKVAMKPYFIPETTTLDEQMREFLQRRTHFALVVDEYGDLQGLITLEDILEEIVGDITDEHDVVSRGGSLVPAPDGGWLVDGAMTIRDLNRAMDWTLPDDAANTVAGLVIHEAMVIPSEGQVFSFHGFRFEVVARRENRVARLKIRPV